MIAAGAAGTVERAAEGWEARITVMTRSGLIKRLAAANPRLHLRDLERIVATVFQRIGSALSRGDRVELRGFGAFSTRGRGERVGRNPRTGEKVVVPGKAVPHFRGGKELLDCLNQLRFVKAGIDGLLSNKTRKPGNRLAALG